MIQPEQEPFVYNDNAAAKAALDAQQVDAIVLDLPTAFFVSAVEIEGTAVIGQFPASGDEPEQFGMVFEEGNPLRDCVNEALAALEESGELDEIEQEWLSDAVDAPVIPSTRRELVTRRAPPDTPDRRRRAAGPAPGRSPGRAPAQRRRAASGAAVDRRGQHRRRLRRADRSGRHRSGLARGPPQAFFSRRHFAESLARHRSRVLAERADVRDRRGAASSCSPCCWPWPAARRAPALFPVRVLATVYVDLFRGIPVLLVLFLLGFGVPALRLDGRARTIPSSGPPSRWS